MTAQATYQLKTNGISAEDFGGELVAVNFNNGKYYGLSGSAPMIWSLLKEARSAAHIINEVCCRTGASEGQVKTEVECFLQRLQDEMLVTVVTRTGEPEVNLSDTHETTKGEKQKFKTPELTVYSDLQELIMLDPVHDADPEHGWPVRREDHSTGK